MQSSALCRYVSGNRRIAATQSINIVPKFGANCKKSRKEVYCILRQVILLYQNLIFDLGGVVVNYDPKDYLVENFFYEKLENKIYDATFGSEEWRQLDLGAITYSEACDIFMKRAKHRYCAFEMQAVLDNWTEMLTDRRATINLMRLFKKRGYHLYYLSNIAHHSLAGLKERKWWTLFDGGIASCEVGLVKPNVRIYEMLLQKYGLVPSETLFTDDNPMNAKAAFGAGITGIHFKNVNDFIKMLLTYGIDLKKKP